jgi:hypothetical protein
VFHGALRSRELTPQEITYRAKRFSAIRFISYAFDKSESLFLAMAIDVAIRFVADAHAKNT